MEPEVFHLKLGRLLFKESLLEFEIHTHSATLSFLHPVLRPPPPLHSNEQAPHCFFFV